MVGTGNWVVWLAIGCTVYGNPRITFPPVTIPAPIIRFPSTQRKIVRIAQGCIAQ